VLFLLTAACCAPSVYVQSAYPENRALTAANFLLTAFLIGAGYIGGGLFQQFSLRVTRLPMKQYAQVGLMVLLLLTAYVVYGGIQTVSRAASITSLHRGGMPRRQQISELKANGDLRPVITAPGQRGGLQELAGNPARGVNRCAAGYYEVDSIARAVMSARERNEAVIPSYNEYPQVYVKGNVSNF
jgi:hypothetical protein